MAYTLGEAAKATGSSKASISRAINSGRISAIKTESGSFSIEPVELHRVYPTKSSAPVSGVPSETVRNTGGDTGNTSDSNVLQASLNAALEQLRDRDRSEEHTSELQSLMRISYAVFCLKKKKKNKIPQIQILLHTLNTLHKTEHIIQHKRTSIDTI